MKRAYAEMTSSVSVGVSDVGRSTGIPRFCTSFEQFSRVLISVVDIACAFYDKASSPRWWRIWTAAARVYVCNGYRFILGTY